MAAQLCYLWIESTCQMTISWFTMETNRFHSRIQHEIMTNLDGHPPVSRMRPTGQDEFEERFGIRDKNMFGQINKDRMVIIFERYSPTKITVCPVSIRKVKHVLLKMIHIRFDIFPGNKVNQRQMFKIMPKEQGQHGNTHHWSKPKLNVVEKNVGIHWDGENRHITRVDRHDYKTTGEFSYISSEMPLRRLFYRILGDKNSAEIGSKNSKQIRKGQIMLFYDQSGWNITISSYLVVNNNDNGQLPTDLSIFQLTDLVWGCWLNQIEKLEIFLQFYLLLINWCDSYWTKNNDNFIEK